jgi:hypothetical protein
MSVDKACADVQQEIRKESLERRQMFSSFTATGNQVLRYDSYSKDAVVPTFPKRDNNRILFHPAYLLQFLLIKSSL